MELVLLNLKAMIVVLAIATAVFSIAKPLCLKFIEQADFMRRRNVWFALTLTAFASPSYWLFVLVALPLLAWSARKDTNPVALYLLAMHVISPVGLQLPTIGINQLFELSPYRILSFAILIPAAWRLMRSRERSVFDGMGVLLLAYGGLQLVLFMPYESVTNSARRGFLFFVDVLVLYFVVSRTLTSRRAIVEAMLSFCLACAVLAPLALFESLRGWLLYQGIGEQWGTGNPFIYVMRGDALRSSVSTGHPIALGYMMAIAFGFWLYLGSREQLARSNIAVAVWIWIGLLAAYSRSPWVVAVIIFIAYLGLNPNGFARMFKVLLFAAPIAGLVLVSPIGGRVIDNLPFVGTVAADTVDYRQRVADSSWQLIRENPFFGRSDYVLHLEDLRQGQGIIDIMNSYANIAMSYGLVGLSLFLGFFVVGMWKVYRLARSSSGQERDLSLLGASLIACMSGTLVMMATGSFGTSLSQMYWVLAGLAAAYARLGQLKEPAPGQPPRKPRPQSRRATYRI